MTAQVLQLSAWLKEPAPLAPALAGDVKADVVIIGGGYTGLSTALALREKGVDVVLPEQEFCGFGASGRNAGQLTPTIGKDAPTLALMFGAEKAGALMKFADRAVQCAEKMIAGHGIDCEYEPVGNIIAGVHPKHEKALRKAADAGSRLGAHLTWLDPAEMRRRGVPPAFTFGVLEGCGGHLHPGKYVLGLRAAALKAGVRVHEKSLVTAIEEGPKVRVRTAAGSVTADKLVIATNAFTPVTLKRFRNRVCPVRVSLFRTAPMTAEQQARMGWAGREGIYTAHEILESYRPTADGRIVGGSKMVNYAWGGGLPPAEQPETFELLESAFRDRFPMLDDVPIESFWGGWIGMTLDFLPMCGITGKHSNIHYGLAYNGHGIAQASYMGRLLGDQLTGVANEDAALLKRRGIPIPPEPLRWLVVKGLIALFAGMDRGVDRALARKPRRGPVRGIAIALLLVAAGAATTLRLTQHSSAPEVSQEIVEPPPAKPRPPGVRPSIKWFPESPRYQAARREHYASSTNFREHLDLGTEQWSRQRLYRVSVGQRPEPALNQFQAWSLQIATAEGQPVTGAVVNVNGGMPQHGHGMPTQPQVHPGTAPGEYRVDGLQFSMPGWWEVHVYVSKDRIDDIATFNLVFD